MMAKCNSKVYLGYVDEYISEKHAPLLNYNVNKIGGHADWPTKGTINHYPCVLCGLERPLVLQIYAPLEGSPYHRTLYLFACFNPNCWNQPQSWTCVRCQILDSSSETRTVNNTKASSDLSVNVLTDVSTWCSSADDWDSNNSLTENNDEENGNVIHGNSNQRVSDEDDESGSLESDSIEYGLGNMAIDDRNANIGAQGGGAAGRVDSSSASAELEGDESELVTIDSPIAPHSDVYAMLHYIPDLSSEVDKLKDTSWTSFAFEPYFIAVEEEQAYDISTISDHIQELLQEYQMKNEDCNISSPSSPGAVGGAFAPHVAGDDQSPLEEYEKSGPAHGDITFHNFLRRIQKNPGQIIRYSREGSPLLMNCLVEGLKPNQCTHCGSEMVFELQLLPTLITKLRLIQSPEMHLEFGTILVYTCKKSCWSSGTTFLPEAVVLQMEKYSKK